MILRPNWGKRMVGIIDNLQSKIRSTHFFGAASKPRFNVMEPSVIPAEDQKRVDLAFAIPRNACSRSF